MRAFLTVMLLLPSLVKAIEKPDFTLIEQMGDVEIRAYPDLIVARTLVDASFKRAGSQGFKRLGGYIFGDNQADEKIAMTAPVAQTLAEDGGYWISFYMPAAYDREQLPLPNDATVEIERLPAQTVAVMVYKGNWSQERFRDHEQQLRKLLAQSDSWQIDGEAIWARYNPPITPSFFRTNEVMIPVTKRGSVER